MMERLRGRIGPLRVDRWIAIIFGVAGLVLWVMYEEAAAPWTFVAVSVIVLGLVAGAIYTGTDLTEDTPLREGPGSLPQVKQRVGTIDRGGDVVGADGVGADVQQDVQQVKGTLAGLRSTDRSALERKPPN